MNVSIKKLVAVVFLTFFLSGVFSSFTLDQVSRGTRETDVKVCSQFAPIMKDPCPVQRKVVPVTGWPFIAGEINDYNKVVAPGTKNHVHSIPLELYSGIWLSLNAVLLAVLVLAGFALYQYRFGD